jgi:uncharacterized sporulation protein YeaH/YhbH (DUF444 family)
VTLSKRIKEDHKRFRDVIEGRARQGLRHLIKTAQIVEMRPKKGHMTYPIKQIGIPHFVHTDGESGIGRGPGKEGDVVGRDPQPGKGNQAGDGDGDFVNIQVDLEDVLKIMGEDLKLPAMLPKPSQTFEEVKIKYNDVSKTGPESLRINRRTIREAIKRLAQSSQLEDLKILPSCKVPIRLITPINSDRRYRQYKEIKIPSSNAVIFFARDCSGSMDDYRCNIVSDMAFWLDIWIRQFYKRVQRCYFVHDTHATEVNEEAFYTYRYGGGTMCSSAFAAIAEQLKNRFPPTAYNVYIFYFTDGDNWAGDNEKMLKIMEEELGPNIVNLIGITQVCPYGYEDTVKKFVDTKLKTNELNSDIVRVAEIKGGKPTGWGYTPDLPDRNEQIIDAIRSLLVEDTK